MLIFLTGFMASGKTKTAKTLAKKIGFDFLDLDRIIEREFQRSISELFDKVGEDAFRLIEQNALHKVTTKTNAVISCGGGTPCFFNNAAVLNYFGKNVFIETDENVLFERLKIKKFTRPLIANKSDEDLKIYISELLEIRNPFYKKAEFRILNTGIKEKNADLIIETLNIQNLIK